MKLFFNLLFFVTPYTENGQFHLKISHTGSFFRSQIINRKNTFFFIFPRQFRIKILNFTIQFIFFGLNTNFQLILGCQPIALILNGSSDFRLLRGDTDNPLLFILIFLHQMAIFCLQPKIFAVLRVRFHESFQIGHTIYRMRCGLLCLFRPTAGQRKPHTYKDHCQYLYQAAISSHGLLPLFRGR